MTVAPPPLKAKTDNREDWIEKIYTQKEKIIEFQVNARNA